MDKEKLASELVEVFTSGNKKDILSKTIAKLKGENLMLAILMQMGGKSTPGELMSYSDFTAARLTAIAKQLQSKGFVDRIQSAEDKRSTIIEITVEGIAYFMKIQQEIIEDILSLIEKLGENDASEFLRLIKRLGELSNQTI